MTSPVTTAPAPSARTASTSDSGGTDSAEPFASALDGALGSGRAAVDGTGAQAGGDPGPDQDDAAAAEAAAPTPAEAGPTANGGVVAALWALLTGAAKAPATETPADGTDGTVVGAPVAAGQASKVPPGLAVAAVAHARAAGVAHGVHGTQPGKLRAEAAASPTGTAPADAAPTTPGTAAPTTPPPPPDAARAAVEALAAAGVSQVVSENVGTTPTTDTAATGPVAAPVTAAAPTTGNTTAAPTVAPVATDGALPIAAPDASGGAAADTGSGADPGENGPAATDVVQTAVQAAPTTPTAPVGRAEGATGDAVAQPVSGQIAKHVAVLRGGPDGSHTMTVVLTPESLGPVEVSVTVSKGAVELTLRGAHEHGHAALLDAVPDLRRDLEAAGLTCSRLDVDRGSRDGAWSSAQQNAGRFGEPGQGGRGSQHDRPDGGARPWHRSADRGDGPRATTRTASGLDVRV